MKVAILYFSGTGNTHYLANEIFFHLQGKGHNVHIFPYEKLKHFSALSYDMLFIGSPIYACRIPKAFISALDSLKTSKQQEFFVFYSYAYICGTAVTNLKKQLKWSAVFRGSCGVKMPASDSILIMKKNSRYIKKWENQGNYNKEDLDELVRTSQLALKDAAFQPLPQKILRFLSQNNILKGLLSQIVYQVGQLLYPRIIASLKADESCIGCSMCEQICPLQNIAALGTDIRFGSNCSLCLRCIHQCPTEAIQLGQKTKGTARYRGPQKDFDPFQLFR